MVLTNANFKNLFFEAAKTTATLGYKTLRLCGSSLREEKCLCFNENPTKTRTGGLTVKHRKTPQEMWATDGQSERSCQTVRRVSQQATFRNANLWSSVLGHNSAYKNRRCYTKSSMGSHKVGSIMKTLAQALNLEGKPIFNHSTRKSVVAKLKRAGQPQHKLIQITGHANESSLNDYDEIEEDERRALSHIKSGYPGTHTKTTMSKTPPSSSSVSVLPSLHAVLVPLSSASTLTSTEQTSAPFSTH